MVQTAPKLPMQRGSYISKYRCEENENGKEESNTDRSYVIAVGRAHGKGNKMRKAREQLVAMVI